MKESKDKKVIYYEDELNEEFSGTTITPRKIDENYKFIHNNILYKISEYLVQNVLSMPFKILYSKIKFNHKFIGKEKFKECKNTGYFVYANHTQNIADTFIPSLGVYRKRNFLIVNPENVSMKYLGNFVQMLGAIPIPNFISGMEKFMNAIEYHISKKHVVTIYPEAHIWPFYTKIRPFKSVSFKYPVVYNKPVFAITNTYKRYGKNNDKIRIISYVDGPFYPNLDLSKKEMKEDLRNKVYDVMCKRAKNSDVCNVIYIKKENKEM